MSKRQTVNEQYYSLSEKEIQELIERFKQGDDTAQMEMLEIFSNFLTKYTSMLYYNRYSLSDYDIRRFIALLVKDKLVRQRLSRNQLNFTTRKQVEEVMRGITYMVRRYGDIEDIEQTVQMTFLQAVERYEKRGAIPFSGYLYSYFFYLLKKNVETLLIDQLGRRTFALIDDEAFAEEANSDSAPNGFTGPAEPGADELIFTELIDEKWVSGETAEYPFDKLTVQERQLLKWRYVNKNRTVDIANITTEHPNTVRDHLAQIRSKLRDLIEEEAL